MSHEALGHWVLSDLGCFYCLTPPMLLFLVVSGGWGLACSCSPGPVGGDGSQAAHQVVTEGAKLRQGQVSRHLDLIVTMKTRGQLQFLIQHTTVEGSRLLHLHHRNMYDCQQPITVKSHQATVMNLALSGT